MNDLFDSIQEAKDERTAIQMADGIETTSEELHRCEVKAVIRQCYPDGKKAAEYFEIVESRRGHLAANRLRDDCRVAWKAKQIEGKDCE